MLANSKKRIINILVILTVHFVSVNAQFFVEGSVGAQYWGGSSSLDGNIKDNPSSYSLNVSPLMGYRLNENVSLGVRTTFLRNTRRFIYPDPDTGDEVLWERKSPGWSLAAFDRYKLWGAKKFSLLVESSIYMSEYNQVEKRGSATTQNLTHSAIGINAFPLISCDLSERFSITFSTDFLRLDLYTLTENNKDTGKKTKNAHFEFNGQSTILNSLSEIRIGIIYHFKKSGK